MADKDNYVIFNPEGGLGKIIASTAVVRCIEAKYPDYKIIVLTPWPEVFLNNPRVHKVFKSGMTPYFYRDYLEGRESTFPASHLLGYPRDHEERGSAGHPVRQGPA